MRLAIVWWHEGSSKIYPNWRDGLRAALEIIAQDHTVDYFFDEEAPGDDYDVVIFWGPAHSDFFNYIFSYSGKKGIFLSTIHTNDPKTLDKLTKLDMVFVESQPILDILAEKGIKSSLAFGTDTDFFCPDNYIVKDIEYFYPATFSPWKKQSDIAHLGDKLLCVGTVQSDGVDELEVCRTMGVQIKIGYFPAEEIRDYYRRTKNIVIPAVHGSERTCLEAMSTDILPEVTNPLNIKTQSYIKEYEQSGCASPREFVLKNYSAQIYAEKILEGING